MLPALAMFGVGAGLQVAGGLMGKSAADKAQAGQLGMLEQAQQASRLAAQNAASMFQPYQLYGSGALGFLQSRLLNGTERQMAAVQQRTSLQADIDRLSVQTDWNSMPILTGAKASERRAEMWQKMEHDRKTQLQAAQSRYTAYDREQAALAPYQKEQEAQLKATQERITNALDLVAEKSNFNIPQSLSQLRNELGNDPIFQFRQQQGERAINRAQAARGNFLSGAALASIGDFNSQLTADETERYFNRIIAGQTASLQGAVTGLNAELGANQQDISNLMGLSQMGLNASQGAANTMMQGNQMNAQISGQAATAYGQTELAKGQAMQGMMSGMGQMAGQAAGFSLMQSMMAKAPAAPTAGGTASAINPTGLTGYNAGGQDFLVNAPR